MRIAAPLSFTHFYFTEKCLDMGCESCGTGKPGGCKSNGGCSTGGCNRMNVHDWLINLPFADPESSCKVIEMSFNNGSPKFLQVYPASSCPTPSMRPVEGTNLRPL